MQEVRLKWLGNLHAICILPLPFCHCTSFACYLDTTLSLLSLPKAVVCVAAKGW